jgi:hypothetical protein
MYCCMLYMIKTKFTNGTSRHLPTEDVHALKRRLYTLLADRHTQHKKCAQGSITLPYFIHSLRMRNHMRTDKPMLLVYVGASNRLIQQQSHFLTCEQAVLSELMGVAHRQGKPRLCPC